VADVEAAWRRRIIVYTDGDFDARYPVIGRLGRDLWTRRYPLRPKLRWTIWQLHGYAHVGGIVGGADLDVAVVARLR
jgi:GH25 family lysozyme M1 (1,4-beta-N-acetylmuramidase)